MTPAALAVLAGDVPPFSVGDARAIARRDYGLDATVEQVVSERDSNFRLRTAEGDFILKIANADEDPAFTDFQICALRHIAERADGAPPVPRLCLTGDGSDRIHVDRDGKRYTGRVVSWLAGTPLSAAKLKPALCRTLGASLAGLDRALAGFRHPGSSQPLAWDLRQAPALGEVIDCVADPHSRRRVAACLEEFSEIALPAFDDLRAQVIHNDFNPGNVLLGSKDPATVAGIIDFGDMQHAPLVVDLAVGAAYLRTPDGDPLSHIEDFVAGYASVTPLERGEIALLYDLVSARLATTVAILEWRRAAATGNAAYRAAADASESGADAFLERLRVLGRADVTERLAQAARAADQPVS